MNNLDKKYTDLLQDILDNGVKKETRNGGAISVFGRQIRHKMSEGFPLLTTKKMYFKGIVTELIWFLRGDTNIKFLVDNDCHIWDGDCYSNYGKKMVDIMNIVIPSEFMDKGWVKVNSQGKWDVLSKEEFINKIKTDDEFAKKWGDLGPIYGKQWRNWQTSDTKSLGGTFWGPTTEITENSIDQIANLINDLKTNPDSRRLMINAWNVGELDQMTLPPCHYGFQVYTRELSLEERRKLAKYDSEFVSPMTVESWDRNNIPTRAISLMFNMRSNDVPLGLPFNLASYGLLLEILAKEVNMVPDELIASLGDAHIYVNQIDGVKEQLTREPYPLPKLMICDDMRRTDGFKVPFDELDYSLIKLIDYQSHPTIKMPLSN